MLHKYKVFLKDGSVLTIAANKVSVSNDGVFLYDANREVSGMYFMGNCLAHIPTELYLYYIREDALDEA